MLAAVHKETNMSMQPIVFPATSQIQNFFFEAALATYAGGTKKSTIHDLPCSKVYRFGLGGFHYVDVYFTNGEQSGGQTVIYFQNVPVWLMQYHGWCRNNDKGCLDFLKLVLSETYERRMFCGGRGAPNKNVGLFFYENLFTGDFHQFVGSEFIHRGLKKVFWHRYFGQLLIPADKDWLATHIHLADLT